MFEESMSAIPSIWASMNSWFTPSVLFVLLNLIISTIAITSRLATRKPHHDQHQERVVQAHAHHSLDQLDRSPSLLQRFKSINFYSYGSQEGSTLIQEKAPDFDAHLTLQQRAPLQELFHQPPTPPTRSPSIVLQKLRSINLSNYFRQQPITTTDHYGQETYPHSHFPPEQIYGQTREEEKFLEQGEGEEEEGENEQLEDHQEQTLDEIYRMIESNNKVNRSKSDTKPASGETPTKLLMKMRKSSSFKSVFAHFEEDDIVETRRPATVKEGKPKVSMGEYDDEVDARADDFIHRFKQQLKLQRIDSVLRYRR
uniref:Uncharacterized protein LOC105638146 n=1 Tax=Rhizophora mucronata TaxID=61149 RepID=A0A2P2N381_RHIMU